MNISGVREPFATLPDWPLQTTAKIFREARDRLPHRLVWTSEDYMFKSNNEVLFLNKISCSSARLPDNMRSGRFMWVQPLFNPTHFSKTQYVICWCINTIVADTYWSALRGNNSTIFSTESTCGISNEKWV